MTEKAQMLDRMTALIRSEVCGAELPRALFDGMTEGAWEELEAFAAFHELSHIVGNAAIHYDLLPEGKAKETFCDKVVAAASHFQLLERELALLRAAFAEEKIPFICLKGAVLRKYYPTPWLRTSCDIDLLLPPADLGRAAETVKRTLGCVDEGKTTHDLSVYTADGGHIELHHTLVEEDYIGAPAAVLQTPWEHAVLIGGCEYVFSDAMFYYYHLAHMAKHIVHGGCGVRTFLDLWVLNHRHADGDARRRLLEKGGLTAFADAATALSEVWFSGAASSGLTDELAAFILAGGVYGSRSNYVKIHRAQTAKSNASYLWHRIWMPYEDLCTLYPSLEGKRALQPLYEVRRWFRLFSPGRWRRSVAEAKTSHSLSDEDLDAKRELLATLRLL